MYVGDQDTTTLRQGDIISNIHLLGAIDLTSVEYLSDHQADSKPRAYQIRTPEYGDAMVMSHCCEIDQANTVKVTSILLAPLRNVNRATHPNRVEELKSSNLIDVNKTEASFLKYFYISENPAIEFKNGAVADFSKLFSVRKSSYNYLLENKVAQLSDDMRYSMSLKLALFFHRAKNAA